IYFIRGRIPREERNPINRFSISVYDKLFRAVMRFPFLTLAVVIVLGISTIYPITRLGSEFMPPLDEGDLLYMPTTDPSISVTKARQVIQQTDKLLKTFPEVISVYGKIGRADTATDPAPLDMIETVTRLQTDTSKWRTRKMHYFFSDWPRWITWPLRHTFWHD